MTAHTITLAAASTEVPEIGRIIAIAGSAAEITLDARLLSLAAAHGWVEPGAIGSHLKLRIGDRWIVAQLRTLRLADADSDLLLGTIDFIGEGRDRDGMLVAFQRGVTRLPMPGCPLLPLNERDLAQVYATDSRPHITIGTVEQTAGIRAALYVDPLLSRHFAIVGSTGTGKSSSTALILHRICDAAPAGHILMIDPHGEYAASFSDRGAVFDVGNLALPYWLMNSAEHAEILVTASGPEGQVDRDILGKCLLAARARNRAAEGLTRLTVDSPIPYILSDLGSILAQEMGKLDKGGVGAAPYMRLKARLDEIKADPRYAFMFSGMLVADSMADTLARLLRLPGEGKPIAIIDLSGVPSEITSVVVALLGRLIFDHAIWSRGSDRRPVLLVCEEAHRYVPAEGWAPARAVLERIAKEGRKYGVALGLISQRPSDLAEGVLSQCGTIVAMRLNNEHDQRKVRAAVPEGARGLIDAIPALRNREAVVVGEAVAIPIRLAFDDLEPERLPASHDPSFAGEWQHSLADRATLDRTIKRWRTQAR
ncbi:ATP-binding protein [Sphingomonas sp. MMS24-J13]|uniref:ATP-binding protein n=1 Tax=Sphingomonas sp. MMS24-J13 TaxID=3238686 RepID=UPI003850D439